MNIQGARLAIRRASVLNILKAEKCLDVYITGYKAADR
jgi:hypothetical protein